MANIEAYARSNYFSVKPSFAEWIKDYDVEVINATDGTVCLLFNDGIPSWSPVTEDDIDFVGELAKHLTDGHVAILMEVGHEKLRSVYGYATAVHSDGKFLSVNLHEIVESAKSQWPNSTITYPES